MVVVTKEPEEPTVEGGVTKADPEALEHGSGTGTEGSEEVKFEYKDPALRDKSPQEIEEEASVKTPNVEELAVMAQGEK